MRTAEIKRRFLAHFEANGHAVVPSAPLPAIDDPNLLFINAGMVQFVPYFLGQRSPAWKRATSVQKCLRTPEVDEVRYLEFWNLVFMQYEITDVRSKEDFRIVKELPSKNIDTGMGLERIASILQGVDNLYEIDEVKPILDRAAELTGKRYGAHSGHAAIESHPDDVRLRVIADHVRTTLMLISDGVTPANEG